MRAWPSVLAVACVASACADSSAPSAPPVAGDDGQHGEKASLYLGVTLRTAEAWLEVVRASTAVAAVREPQPCSDGGTVTVGRSDDAVAFTFAACQQRADAPSLTGSVLVGPDGSGLLALQADELVLDGAEGPLTLAGTVVTQQSSATGELVVHSRTALLSTREAQRTQLTDFTLTLRNAAVGMVMGTELTMTAQVEDSRLGQQWALSTPARVRAAEAQPGGAPVPVGGTLALSFAREATLQVRFDNAGVNALWDLDLDGYWEDGPYSLPRELREAPGLFRPWSPTRLVGEGDDDGAPLADAGT